MLLLREASLGRLSRGWLLLAGLCAALHAQPGGAPFNCVANASATSMRVEGLAERTADITLSCTGGSPVAAGGILPMVNLTVFFNAPITSRLYATTWSEALLLVNEPGSGVAGTANTQLACNDPNGNCQIIATGTGRGSYEGSTGRPNVFQGRVSGNA